ncbi:FAD/FMN-containing dehydrogenase [Saccharopolyspora erythraea NRRL 2338]|uniref:Delta(24)-sterol reductase n=2 Tax=Saccharopolyspora erythraea TaxID=1836 RepID=A4FB76_SACEN|nr:FAD-binding oxidoreductase [Saccharopolyspora erythraea]EQD83974.1 FAD-linked oxidase [Saccharopolyspora erythraea D]PFG95083.1 FAD/FMN-containing dehydrogenase [Saccharopolyspora erythraea NRRL 2338]QRK91761.1 FAD-binding oxidoreductase [Saccharopolyspora erythraea]CAM01301.1 FAD linked oxidase-like protein [Saccharopolyspora erythraea NRRL 2338]
MGTERGTVIPASHTDEVAALAENYARLPAGEPVRLAKATSNLFRFRDPAAGPGLDVGRLNRVLAVDPSTRTAQVQGMATYESIVDAHLPSGHIPLVVPQLKTITLGGAIAGLGIESTSFRNGLPHESVREMEILTGDGRVVVARPDNEHAELFRGFPNSYGTLGYALRLEIELEPVQSYVRLRHLRFGSAGECAEAIASICRDRAHDGHPVDFLDGTVFSADEQYLTLGEYRSDAPPTSDYTGQQVYYRSLRTRQTDHLSIRDYLWRWDTDWFWCSRAFGVQHPLVRRFWPRRYRRSDVYRRIVSWDRRFGLTDRLSRLRGGGGNEPVIQDVEIPVGRLAEFLEFFHAETGISPVWLCPVRLRDRKGWPLYPMDPDTLYVNVGFWSAVPLRPGEEPGTHNRAIERVVSELDGHKSLYSNAYYGEDEFWRLYNRPAYQRLKERYDPDGRLPGLYDKCVREK